MNLKMYFLKYIDPEGRVFKMPFFFATESKARRFCRLNKFTFVRELDPNNFDFEEPVHDSNSDYPDDYQPGEDFTA